jgi:hypothetical protein
LACLSATQAEAPPEENRQWMDLLKQSCERASAVNTWFTPQNIRAAVASWADALQENKLKQWMKPYSPEQGNNSPGKIAVVMAGNIPLVGMHDFVTVLISGNHFLGKLSSNDNILLKTISEILCAIEPGFADLISFTDGRIEGYDAVIATGSNNTSRFFEYYFPMFHISFAATGTGQQCFQEMKVHRSWKDWAGIFAFISGWGAGAFQRFICCRI